MGANFCIKNSHLLRSYNTYIFTEPLGQNRLPSLLYKQYLNQDNIYFHYAFEKFRNNVFYVWSINLINKLL